MPLTNWSTGVACCPNCRHELRVSLTPASGKCHTSPHTPPPFTVQPTYLPHSPLYATPSSPLIPTPYNDELRRLADTLRALRLSGWYYGSLDWQVSILKLLYFDWKGRIIEDGKGTIELLIIAIGDGKLMKLYIVTRKFDKL